MKKFVCLMAVLAVSPTASAQGVGNVIEDFEGYDVGDVLGVDPVGWTELWGQGTAVVRPGLDGSKVAVDDDAFGGGPGFNVARDAGFAALGSGYTGPAHLAARFVPGLYDGSIRYTAVTVRPGTNGWAGPQISVSAVPGAPAVGRFGLMSGEGSGYPAEWYSSTTRCLPDHIYDVVLNMDIVSAYEVYGTVFHRDVTPGHETLWTEASLVDALDAPVSNPVLMNSNPSAGPYNATHLTVHGTHRGEIDNLAWGPGHVPVSRTAMAMGFEVTRDVWVTEAYLPAEFELAELLCEYHQPGSYETLRNGGVSLSTAHVKEGAYSGKWTKHNYWPTMWTDVVETDWSGYDTISFRVYSELATNEEIFLTVHSDSGSTPWADFFVTSFVVDWTGWKKIEIALADFETYEDAVGWAKVDSIHFRTKMFNRQPNPYAVLYFDDMRLYRFSPPGSFSASLVVFR